MLEVIEKPYTAHSVATIDGIEPERDMVQVTNSTYRDVGKRILDVTLVLVGGVFLLPIMFIIGVLVSRDGGPALYSQKRVGIDGREFTFWKFRSMVVDSEERLAQHLAESPEAALEWSVNQKLRNDPRITPIGRIIRKTSIDELPQLWNILKGDMSLVGPRPMMPQQRALYPGKAYFSMRPGLTGYWQVSERNEVSFAERAKFDSDYWQDMSLATDISTLFRTVGAVVRGSGC
ncbi:MAG: sugar transferase [Pseudomonadota bacterium]